MTSTKYKFSRGNRYYLLPATNTLRNRPKPAKGSWRQVFSCCLRVLCTTKQIYFFLFLSFLLLNENQDKFNIHAIGILEAKVRVSYFPKQRFCYELLWSRKTGRFDIKTLKIPSKQRYSFSYIKKSLYLEKTYTATQLRRHYKVLNVNMKKEADW